MRAARSTSSSNRQFNRCWRKARLAARLLLKKGAGRSWTRRDRELARRLAQDESVTNRLIDQALKSLQAKKKHGYSILDVIP